MQFENYVKEVKEYIRICKGKYFPKGFILFTNMKLPKKHFVALLALGKLYSYAMNLSQTPTITSGEFIKTLKYCYLKRIKRGEYEFDTWNTKK